MDTICINKESSAELDESIRSMFKWYSRAHVCITHLADTMELENMRNDTWFTRGWTLQELLAPPYTKFYNAQWERMRADWQHDLQDDAILDEIEATTTIDKTEITKPLLWSISISRKMQWAANRKVTRAEDTAYSLMGIFGVSISTAYGEGPELAFIRLVKEILASKHNTLDIMNFGHGTEFPSERSTERAKQICPSSLIPSSPKQYLWRKSFYWQRPTTPATLTHIGLRVSVLLIPGIAITDLPSPDESHPIGDYFATITENFLYPNNEISPGTFSLLDSCIYKKSNTNDIRSKAVVFFGVLNFYETETTVELSPGNICYAKILSPIEILSPVGPPQFDLESVLADTSKVTMLFTPYPTVFALQPVKDSLLIIPKADLEKNGMYLRTMYL